MSQHDAQSRLATGNGAFCPGLDETPVRFSEVARRRRDEVMDAAEAIIAGEGIHKLSLAQVEERAGMSRGQLTYYFPTKETILLAVYERMLRRMIREVMAGDGPKPMTGRAEDCFRHALASHLDLDSTAPRGRRTNSSACSTPSSPRWDIARITATSSRRPTAAGASTSQPMSRIACPNRGRSSRVSRPACCRR